MSNNETGVEPVKEKPKAFNYSDDRRGWVIMKNGTKTRLRKYIAELARKLTKFNSSKFSENRQYLIDSYEIGGLENMHKAINTALQAQINRMDKKKSGLK